VSSRVAIGLVVGVGLLCGAAAVHTELEARSGEPVLGAVAPAVDSLLGAGAALHRGGSLAALQLRVPAAAALLLVFGALIWRGRGWRGLRGVAGKLLGLAVAFTAQAFVSSGDGFVGAALYVLGIALFLLSGRASLPEPTEAGRAELLAVLGLAAGFLALGLYEIDVRPGFYVDEGAYTVAAKMTLGELPEGEILGRRLGEVYVLERFQAQPLPLGAHVATLASASTGVIALRVVALLALTAALLVTHLVFRPRLGWLPVLGMWLLAAASPLFSLYGRVASYIPFSILHATVCVALLLRARDRWTLGSAVGLGAALGMGLYLYQISWFVPVLAGASALAWTDLWRRPGAVARGAAVVASAAVVVLPSLFYAETGFQQLRGQTFDKGSWRDRDHTLAFALAPAELGAAAAERTVSDLAAEHSIDADSRRLRSLQLRAWENDTDVGAVAIGPLPEVAEIFRELAARGWHPSDLTSGAVDNVVAAVQRLFVQPGWESNGRIVSVGLLNPVTAPLLVLGAAVAAARFGDPVLRMLLVWSSLAFLLPTAVAGTLPRRLLLMVPFAFLLAMLPLAEIAAAASRRARPLLAGGGLVLAACGVALGAHLLDAHWAVGLGRASASRLALDRILMGVPETRDAWLAVSFPSMGHHLRSVLGMGEHVHLARRVSPVDARRLSCQQSPPFLWIALDDADGRELERAISRDFDLSAVSRDGYRVIEASARRPGPCGPLGPGAVLD